METEPPLLTVSEATARLAARGMSVHPDTVRRWERKGFITAIRTPSGHRRFRAVDIDAIVTTVSEPQDAA
jgi:excisionase family DNA binding protein